MIYYFRVLNISKKQNQNKDQIFICDEYKLVKKDNIKKEMSTFE